MRIDSSVWESATVEGRGRGFKSYSFTSRCNSCRLSPNTRIVMQKDINEINTWLNEKLASIAKRLPKLVQHEPSSFACGHAMGYKQALLDLDNLLQESCDNEHQ